MGRGPGVTVSRARDASVPSARRLERLCKRLRQVRVPIVWLRALPGSGKTRLLQELAAGPHASRFERWTLLDQPAAAALRATLLRRAEPGAPAEAPLLVASRHDDAVAGSLLTSRMYGAVEILDEHDLFYDARDCRSKGSAQILAATGGWPMLFDAWLCGRQAELEQMLPEFLVREVLPDLPVPVVTALFAALSAPLRDGAVEHLFGAQARLHPFLKARQDGVSVAPPCLSAALSTLRGRRGVLHESVLEELVHLYSTFADPAVAILSLLDLEQREHAARVFERSGGMFFGYRHGYHSLERILDGFGTQWEQRTESLFFARLHLLVKSGKPRAALARLEAAHPRLPVDLRRLRISHRPYAVLMALDINLVLDEVPSAEVIHSWGRLEGLLRHDDLLGRGVLYNIMALGFLRADALPQARRLAEDALEVFDQAGVPYLAHFMLLHLCDLALRQSRLCDARTLLQRAETALRSSALTFNSEPAIIDCFQARIAYEEGRFGDCAADVEPILEALLRGDSWPGLLSTMAGHFVFCEFWQKGLRKSLERLEQVALTLARRHGPTQSRAMLLIRTRLLQTARRHAEACALLDEYDRQPAAHRSACVATEEGLIRLRSFIFQQAVEPALQCAGTLAARTGVETRHRISLSVLQAHLCSRAGGAAPARRHLCAALRLAATENLVGVLVEEAEFVERLLPPFIADPGPGHARLAAFATRVVRLLKGLPCAPLHLRGLAGVSRQEHRVLSYVTDGYANKQIARALALSESAVKFHLRGLFRKLRVSSRADLLEAVRARGIVT